MKEYDIERFENWLFWDRVQWCATGVLIAVIIRLALDYLWANGIL